MREVTKTEGLLTFHVYPETFWEPLEVATNSSLLVEESTSIAITQYDLRVAVRAEMSPKDIIYMVTMTFPFCILRHWYPLQRKLEPGKVLAGNTIGESIIVLLTSCLTGLD
jgi:hypothetical protein